MHDLPDQVPNTVLGYAVAGLSLVQRDVSVTKPGGGEQNGRRWRELDTDLGIVQEAKRIKATKSERAHSKDNCDQGPPAIEELKKESFTLLKWEGRRVVYHSCGKHS